MTAPPAIETARLRLRLLEAADAPALHVMFGDAEAMRFWDLPPSRDVIETAVRIGRSLATPAFMHQVWVALPRSGGEAIAMVNYHHREPWNRRLELGWICARAHWGNGIMTEAVGAFIGHCFAALETHRIEVTIEPDNHPSRRLAERLGFVAEGGPMRDRCLFQGQFRTMQMYALLQPDWHARQGH
jgi:ribosomal-protein-alanine N-acetyltransferase